ncbi:GNAT family N-acetyltransferase [Oscillospiraceae bacterium HV4-5-C5C]|nr:GNAT family N-acetyltransferase [Oscillospiraceae bacterium HV4-5-C5C]
MIVRKITTPAEYARTQEVFAIAFEFKLDPADLNPEHLQQAIETPRGRMDRYWQDRWAAFNDDGEMLGYIGGYPAPVRFDGRETTCTCIGGVSCLPQYRRQGVVASCLRQHLNDSYQAGHVFSYLYPFSTAFYRQFGYELAAQSVDWSFELATLPAWPEVQGTAVLNQGQTELAAIRQVYNQYMAEYNMSRLRQADDWTPLLPEQPAVEGRYFYVWKNQAGQPKAAFAFRKDYDRRTDRTWMRCQEFYFADQEGLLGLLKHIRSYRSHFDMVQIPLPVDVALERVLPEVSGRCRRELKFKGMGRVINARRALELARYRGEGEITLDLNDPIIAANNRSFRVSFQNGRCCSVETYDHAGDPAADLILDIATFSRWLLGGCGAEEIQEPRLRQVFYPKKLYLCDFF